MNRIKSALKALGLDDRDLAIYALLVERGPLTAREIAEAVNTPYTKIYQHLDALEAWGFVERLEGRPARYAAKPPLEVYRGLVSFMSTALRALKEQIDMLQALYEARYGGASTTFIALIRGEKVHNLIEEVIKSSDGAVYVALPYPELITPSIMETIKEESKRIEVKLLSTKRLVGYIDLPPRIDVRALDDMFGGGALGNSAVLVVKHGDGLLGIHGNERYLLDIAKTYFNYLWDKAEPIRKH
ncbi:MAG: helix-turn-helix domain-containing protein [Thermoproteus sp.]